MSAGGSISAMISSIKNNKRTRKSTFEKLGKEGRYSRKTKVHFKQNATKSQLREIRERLISQNKITFLKKIIIIFVLLVITIYFIGFAKF
jgi:hypothetical protein